MKISTKGRYGLKAMIDIALNSRGNDRVTLKSISERQDISERYLEQIFSSLRKNNLVKSLKGPQGGYSLVENTDRITVGDILRALEGTLHVVIPQENIKDEKIDKCIRENVWDKLNESIDKVVDSITLEDLVNEYQNSLNEGYMYYI